MPIAPDRRTRRRRILGWTVTVLAVAGIGAAILREQIKETGDRNTRVAMLTDGGDTARGQQLFQDYGCVACHAMRGVPQAQAMVGPPLDGFGSRTVIAGKLANNPGNLKLWIMDPQAVSPGTLMPRLGVSPGDAKDLAAFIYSRS
jgi:cytochrome c2